LKNEIEQAAVMSVGCNYKSGTLPSCAPLVSTFVPEQQTEPPKYAVDEALTRGTLFPGLDLPFMNIANSSNPYSGTPLGELMALWFAIKELNLYLDTHKDDTDAFEMMKEMIALYDEGYAKYVKKYGPVKLTDLKHSAKYNWLCEPWPWEFCERMGND